jgi:Arc/MetJ-type ribon-helix-helix transcriptional regulator
MRESARYVTVSLPVGIARDIDALIEETGYWPSRGAFVREACLNKLWSERQKLKALKEDKGERAQSAQV